MVGKRPDQPNKVQLPPLHSHPPTKKSNEKPHQNQEVNTTFVHVLVGQVNAYTRTHQKNTVQICKQSDILLHFYKFLLFEKYYRKSDNIPYL